MGRLSPTPSLASDKASLPLFQIYSLGFCPLRRGKDDWETIVKIDAVDLFCGAGGLSYGLQNSGIDVRAGVDLDPACEYPYKANLEGAKFIHEDITKVSAEDITALYRKHSLKLLAGCAPCQPFSTLRNGHDSKKSDKWPLLNEFGRLVEAIRPDFVTMENVPALKGQEVFDDFCKTLERLEYHVTVRVVDAATYGLPQRRKRLVLLASQKGTIRLLSPEELGIKPRTVKDAIGTLPAVESGEVHKDDPLHKAPKLTQINLDRIRASKPGGTWLDWPKSLRSACHTKPEGESYKSVYARMEWGKPAPTITTQSFNFGTGRFGHPEQDRAITLREAAILQSFPRRYKFVDNGKPVNFRTLGRLIGNAVPVDLGYAIGASIKLHAKHS